MDSPVAVSTPALAPVSHARQLTQLEDEITELAAHLNAATYRLLVLIAEFDARGGWGGAGQKSCAHWLNWKCGIALGAAQENQRHALRELSWYIDNDGSFVLKARLDPEQGARVVQALDSATGAIMEEQRHAAEDVSAGTCLPSPQPTTARASTSGHRRRS